MSNIDYTLWPNANGNLGEIKVQIPDGVTTMWPDGDALIHNFVYQNGKLVGFVDTKALILNESATTTFPYDYVDIFLPSIQEGTLTIKRGERCKYLNVKMYRADWLPAGFTELDYLESSGTQYIELPEVFHITKEDNPKSGIKIRSMDYKLVNDNYIFRINCNTTLLTDTYLYIGYRNKTLGTMSMGTNGHNHFGGPTYEDGKIYTAELNFLASNISKIDNDTRGNLWESIVYVKSQSTTLMKNATCKLVDAILSSGTEITRELIPVLNADGVPGMYDKMSKKFFGNQGTGTFGYRIKTTDNSVAPLSLRDPYYVAPSGVYAKLIGENELEIVADTEEVHSDDWVHFANTGEAYEHFGITFEDATLV